MVKSMMPQRHGITIRASVLLKKQNSILVAKHLKGTQEYYVLPGGHVETYESLEAAAIREIKEECNLKVSLHRLLYIGNYIIPKQIHGVDIVFLGKSFHGTLTNSNDPDKKYGVITELKWITLAELKKADFRPATLKRQILKDFKTGFKSFAYLGKYP